MRRGWQVSERVAVPTCLEQNGSSRSFFQMWHVGALFLMGAVNLLTWCILIFVLACQYFLREFIGWTLCRQSLFIVVQTELLKYSHSTICATSGPYHVVHWRHFLWSRVEESQHVLWQWVMIAGKDICSRLKQKLKNSVKPKVCKFCTDSETIGT